MRDNLHYWLYSLERMAMFLGRRYFSKHDWYHLGATHLLETEQPGPYPWGDGLKETCFAVLFLKRAIHLPRVVITGERGK